MPILYKKILAIAVIIVSVIIYSACHNTITEEELSQYKEYLLTLDAEGIIKEHFKNRNENQLEKLNETVIDK